jgi:hypothetical protein
MRIELDLTKAPKDALERIGWLSDQEDEVQAALRAAFDDAYAEAYFTARMQGRIQAALAIGVHSHKRAMAFTRHWNEAIGRPVRWGDGLR